MFTLTVNGQSFQVNVPGDTPLLWVLRDIIGLTGTKYGCGIEVCGACTVMINGQAEKTCEYDVSSAVGKTITTIEGLSPDGASHPLQQAWIAEQVPQCGYCQSGMIMAAAALLNQHPHPTDSDINEIQNVCICGTYQRIRAAIHRAANGG
ncbi:MAG: (2Fe-2S)-binding protein [Chthoniobacterales bacterium]